MIDRYIYAVTKELPEKSRKEIGSELRALIDDMMDGMDQSFSEEEKIDKVLRELGNPQELANRYRGKERYLIGPNYFDKYLFVMKIVVLSIFIGISIATGLGVMFSNDSMYGIIGSYLGTLFSSILQGAAWVTGVFALFEYKEITLVTGMEQGDWEPSQLPELPKKKAMISRGESIFSIIISTIFLPVFFYLYKYIGIYYKVDNEIRYLPLFNEVDLAPFKIFIILVFTINIVIELLKIIQGRWTVKLAIITTVLSIISSTLFISILYKMNIWNPEIVQKFEQFMPISFERMVLLTTVGIIIVTIGESVFALYKGIKYGGD